MLTAQLRRDIQAFYSQFLDIHSFKARISQRQMIASIARILTLNDTGDQLRIGVIEAGTGTGKTLAYLLAALPIAQAQGKKLIISTATINLQEQLTHKDLPQLQQSISLQFNFHLIKGRGRYLCNAKLERLLMSHAQQSLLWNADGNFSVQNPETLNLYQQFDLSLRDKQWNGDRDRWPEIIDDNLWQPLTSDRHQCTGRQCPHIKQCTFFHARDDAHDSDVLVTNHDIVLSDLSLGGGTILPDPQECIYIFDEAHHLVDKTRQHFSVRCRLIATINQLQQMEKQLGKLNGDNYLSNRLGSTVEVSTLLTEISVQLHALYEQIDHYFQTNASATNPIVRFPKGDIPSFLRQTTERIMIHYERLVAGISTLQTKLKPIDHQHEEVINTDYEYGLLGQWLSWLESQAALWENYGQDSSLFARWLHRIEGDKQYDYECIATPILVANSLQINLWQHCWSAILTSATLTSLGNFTSLEKLAGLPDDATYQRLPSPFDYANLATLNLWCKNADPRNREQHTQLLIEQIPQCVDPKAGNLVLFNSERQMNDVFIDLPSSWQTNILLQGSKNKSTIIAEHKRRIDNKQGSIIFGLASFAEGVDLPRDYCTHVVIAKIPFATPDNPVDEALSEWVEMQGGNAFRQVSLPVASLRLIQATGRLIRSEHDCGQITIFDQRLLSQHYGRQLLDALPPFKRRIISA